MKLKMHEAIDISTALAALGDYDTEIWYEIGKNIRKLNPIVKEYNETKRDIQEKYSLKDDKKKIKLRTSPDGREWVEYGNNQVKADDAMKKLNEEDVDIDIHKISVDKLKDSKGEWKYKLKGSLMFPLIDTVLVNGKVKKEKSEPSPE